MKRKDMTDIRSMDAKSLIAKARDLSSQIKDARRTMLTKEVKNRHAVKEMRKKRAVVLTVLQEKALSGTEKRSI